MMHRSPEDLKPTQRRLLSFLSVPLPTPAPAEVGPSLEGPSEGEDSGKYYLNIVTAYPPYVANDYHALRFTYAQWARRNSPQGRLALQRERVESAEALKASHTAGGGDA